MLDQEFCDVLEFNLTKSFKASDDPQLKGFWCDGILPPSLSQESMDENRQVLLTAFLGKDGQDKYDLTLNLGNESLLKLTRGFKIVDCILTDDKHWFEINTVKKTIIIELL